MNKMRHKQQKTRQFTDETTHPEYKYVFSLFQSCVCQSPGSVISECLTVFIPQGLLTDTIPALNLSLQQVKELAHQKRSNKRAPPMDWTKKNELFSNLQGISDDRSLIRHIRHWQQTKIKPFCKVQITLHVIVTQILLLLLYYILCY